MPLNCEHYFAFVFPNDWHDTATPSHFISTCTWHITHSVDLIPSPFYVAFNRKITLQCGAFKSKSLTKSTVDEQTEGFTVVSSFSDSRQISGKRDETIASL